MEGASDGNNPTGFPAWLVSRALGASQTIFSVYDGQLTHRSFSGYTTDYNNELGAP